ncbi:Ig-like domain-containing protein [Pseudomonas sp. MAG002Y]|uniref:Ig-like domain-containing protein n=1 Tax=Pseudomonas sp. MAG002Y TaxID=2678690 RepID=UPI001C60C25C|nr:tandem-95 repeat protein [Pseudomonas sp. MAG002Y]MBW5415824.1 tandem-95 repeat protein [Pseudomonas sp. MAG002Y]
MKRRHSLGASIRIALETRLMFDAAAVVTAENTLHDSNHAHEAQASQASHEASEALSQALLAVQPQSDHAHAVASGDGTAHEASAQPAVHTHPDVTDQMHPLIDAASASSARQEIYFIDSSLPDQGSLLAALPKGADIVYLDPAKDGLEQIASALQGRSGIDALHIVTHANTGALEVGSTQLTATSIQSQFHDVLAEIGRHLDSQADVLIYGCNLAAGAEGQETLRALSHALSADIAASDNTTGSSGDWVLEQQIGSIETTSLQATDWHHDLLANVAVNDSVTVNQGSSIRIAPLSNDVLVLSVPKLVIASPAQSGSLVVNSDNTVTYTPTKGYAGTDSFTYYVRDALLGAISTTGTVSIIVNAAPVLTVPTLSGLVEDTSVTFSSALGTQIRVTDADSTSETVVVSVPKGTLAINSNVLSSITSGLLSGFTVSGNNTGSVTLSGSITDINNALNGLVYTPVADANGLVNLSVTAQDPTGLSASSTIAMNFAPVTDIVADSVVAYKDTSSTFNVLSNDHFENTGRVVTGYSTPSHGTLTIDAQGNAVYKPASGWTGTDTFTYTVTSGGATETATVTVTTVIPNYAPTLSVPGTQSFLEDVTCVFSSSNGNAITVADANGDTLTVTLQATQGNLTLSQTSGLTFISGDGVADATMKFSGSVAAINTALNGLSYIPTPDYNGTAAITLSVSDGTAAVQTANIALNLAPVADGVPDSIQTGPLAPVTFNPLANDNFEGTPSITAVSQGARGVVLLNPNGTVTYTPSLGYTGSDTFTYTVTSGGVTEQVTVNVTVGNSAPVGTSLGTASTFDGGLVLLSTAQAFRDPDLLDKLTYSATGLPAGLGIDPLTGLITGVVNTHASMVNGGVYTVTVTATDLAGAKATSTLVLNVSNPAPIPLVGLTLGGSEDTLLGISLDTLGIIDPDGDAFSITQAKALNGTVTINTDGSLSYQPDADYFGLDTITYTVRDVDGGTATGSIAVVLAAVPDLPVINLPSIPLLTEDTPLIFANLLGQQLSVGNIDGTLVDVRLSVPVGSFTLTQTANVTLSEGDGVNDSTLRISGTAVEVNAALNSLIYTPAADYNGPVKITIDLGQLTGGLLKVQATLPISIAPVQDAFDDQVNVTLNTPVSFNVLANDMFENASRTLTSYTLPAHGNLTLDSQGNAVYTPNVGYLGADSFTYTVTSNGTVETATVTLTTALPNYAPVITMPASLTLAEDTPQIFSSATGTALRVNDANGDELTVTLQINHGSLTLSQTSGLTFIAGDGRDDATLTFRGQVSAINAALEGLAFTPTADYNGTATLTLQASDGKAPVQLATTLLTLTPVTDGVPDSLYTEPLSPVVFNPLANDTFEGTPRLEAVSQGQHGTVTLGQNGLVTYIPAPGYRGVDSFTYTVSSGGVTEQVIVSVTVGTNTPPTAGSLGTVATLDSALVAIPAGQAFRDTDLFDALRFSASGLPAGLAIDSATGLISGVLGNHASTAAPNGAYTVTVTATDLAGASVSSLLVITVSNPPPVTSLGTIIVQEDTPLHITALNITDPDNDSLTITKATALHGTVTINADGSLTYTPNADYNGLDTITYTVVDSDGGTATGLIAVTLQPVADLPTLQLPNLPLLNEDTPLIFANLLGQHLSVGDVDGQILDLRLSVPVGTFMLGQTAGLTFSEGNGGTAGSTLRVSGSMADINAALNSLVYTPGADYNGPLKITLELGQLGQLLSVKADLPVQIVPVADIMDDHVSLVTGQTAGFNVLANDTFENAARAISSFTTPAHGVLTLDAQGNAVYTPDNGYAGTDSFTYTVYSNGTYETATVTLTVNTAPNADPVAAPLPSQAATDSQTLAIEAGKAFSDIDGDTLSFKASGLPAGLSINPATGLISGTLDSHASVLAPNGLYTVVVTASDGKGGQVSQSFTLTVTNPLPVTSGAAWATPENTPYTGMLQASDPDGDTLSFSTVTGPAHGTLTLNPNGMYVYVPTLGYNGTDSFTYQVRDADGGISTATVTIAVTAVNDAPTVISSTATTPEDTPVTLDVLRNVTDPDGDTLTISHASAEQGTVTLNPNGTLTYTPKINFNGTDTITYTVSDGHGGTVTSTVIVIVTPINDAPTATPSTAITPEDTPIRLDVLANASDVDGDSLLVSAAYANHGNVSVNTDGTLTYTPSANFNGTDTVTYTVSDGNGGLVTATVTIIVTPVNDAPVVAAPLADQQATDGSAFSLNVSAAFADIDSPVLSYAVTGLPQGLSFDPATGLISGVLASSASTGGNNGVYTLTVTAQDNQGAQVSQRFTLTVTNPLPIAQPATLGTAEDTPLTGALVATDLDGDALSFSMIQGPAHGSLVLNADGSFTYTPQADYNGTDSFIYQVRDADGGLATATATIVVAPVNDAPVVPAQTATTAEDTPIRLDVLAGATDIDGDTLAVTTASALNGTVSLNLDGTLLYTPNADFNGTDTLTYTVTDGSGGSVTATVTIVVTQVNDVPTATPASATTLEDTPIRLDVLADAQDMDGDALSVVAASAANGTVTVNADGSLLYTPNTNFNGIDTLTYTITDGNGATVSATISITVTPVNDVPVAAPSTATVTEDTAITLDVLANVIDIDGNSLTVTTASAANGAVTVNPDGTLTYTPKGNFNGTDTLIYTVSDGNGGLVTATVIITVLPVNDLPTVSDRAASTLEDTPLTLDLLEGASDVDGDTLSVTAASALNGVLTLSSDGTVVYVPNADFNGTDTLTYTISDGNGGLVTATVSITVTPVNDAPVLIGTIVSQSATDAAPFSLGTAAYFADLDSPELSYSANGLPVGLSIDPNTGLISGTLAGNASSSAPDGRYSITVTAQDDQGAQVSQQFTLTVSNLLPITAGASLITAEDTPYTGQLVATDIDGDALSFSVIEGPAHGILLLSEEGRFTYIPEADYNGTDGFTYQVQDADGAVTRAMIIFTITPVNDAPVAASHSAVTPEDTPVRIDVLADARDVDGDTLTVTTASALNGTVSLNTDGTLLYTPEANFNGVDTVTYTITDRYGSTVTATVTVTVTPINDAPVASPSTATTLEDTPLRLDVTANASDVDGDRLTVVSASATNGSVSLAVDGTLLYTPNADFRGSDTLTYTLSDGNGGTVTSTVLITVTPVNDAPSIRTSLPDQAVSDGSTFVLNVSGYFADVDGDTLSYSATGLPQGLFLDPVTGMISGTLAGNASTQGNNGLYTITFTASDGLGGSISQTMLLTVTNPTPETPAAVITTSEDTAASGVLTAIDPDGDRLSFEKVINPAHGSLALNPDGSFTYTPDTNFNGTDGFTYQVVDADGGTTVATVVITVTPVNDAPSAFPGSASTREDTPLTIDVLAGIDDPEGDTPSLSSALATQGTVTLNADGTLTYTPNANFNGTDTLTYTVSDGNGGTVTSTVTITVLPVNDAPVVLPATSTTPEDTPIRLDVLANASDVDGDLLSIDSASAIHGTVALNPDGSITYTPNTNFNGADIITYTVTDGQGAIVLSTVAITVTPVNDAPTAVSGTLITTEDTPVTLDPRLDVNDIDGDVLSPVSATAINGTVIINADGTLTYTPNADFNGIDTLTYTLSDGNGETVTSTVVITVTPVNDAPDSVSIPFNSSATDSSPFSLDVSGLFSDRDNDVLIYSASGLPAGLNINSATGLIDGVIDSRASSQALDGVYTVTITAQDSAGAIASTTLTLTISNTLPAPLTETLTLNEDTLYTGTLLASDPDGDALSFSILQGPAHGTLSLNDDGRFIYVPNLDFNGTDNFVYQVTDADGAVVTATLTLIVTPVNDAPVVAAPLADQQATDGSAFSLNVSAAFADIDSPVLSYAVTGLPQGLSFDPATGLISGVLASSASTGGNNGVYTLTVTAQDNQGAQVSQRFTLTVTNPLPIAQPATLGTAEDTPLTGALVATDLDGDALSFSMIQGPAHGSLVLNADGSFTYTPQADYNGTDSFIYQVRDADGGLATATATIVVAPVNDAPVVPAQTATTAEDTPIRLDVLAGATDIDGDTLAVTTASALNGTVSLNLDGTLLYTPNADFNGSDTLTYIVSDGNGATVSSTITITVTPVNDDPTSNGPMPDQTVDDGSTFNLDVSSYFADVDTDLLSFSASGLPAGLSIDPVTGVISGTLAGNASSQAINGAYRITLTASDGQGGSVSRPLLLTVTNPLPVTADSVIVTQEDTPLSGTLQATDPDGDALRFELVGAPAHGSLQLNADGSYIYIPDANYNGPDSFSYQVRDADGGVATATVAIAVASVNDAPIASATQATTLEDTPITLDTLANIVDIDGDALSIVTASATNGLVSVNPDGTLTYMPKPDFNGIDTLIYTVTDGNGGVVTATVNITVTPVNDAPVASSNTATTTEDTPLRLDVVANASDVDGDGLTVVSASAVNGGVSLDADGTLLYTPNADFNGTDTLTYTISDGNGGLVTATVVITVTPVNDAPVSQGVLLSQEAADGKPFSLDISAYFADVDDAQLTYTAIGLPAGLSLDPVTGLIAGTLASNASSQGNNGIYTVTLTASDGLGSSVSQQVSFTVTNSVPESPNTTITTVEDVPLSDTLVAADPDGDALTFSLINSPAHGTLALNTDGSYTYTPDADYNGTDSFTYQVTDSDGGTTRATLSIVIVPVNDAPTLVDKTATTAQDNAIVLSVLADARDVDGDRLTIADATASHGAVTVTPEGSLVYTPSAGFTGTDTITYQVSDGSVSVAATVVVTVTPVIPESPVNQLPVAAPTTVAVTAGTAVVLDVVASAIDADGDSLSIVESAAAHGTVKTNPDGTLTYTPDAGFSGTDIVTYTLSDGKGGTVTSTVSVSVTSVSAPDTDGNEAPQSSDLTATAAEDTPVTLDVLALASDADRDPLVVTDASARNGTVTINTDGTITYSPAANFNGSDTLTYTVSDGIGGTTTLTATITVTPVNDTPVAAPITATTLEDTPLRLDVLSSANDVDGDSLSITQAEARNGTVVIGSDGILVYTPASHFVGQDVITYTLDDGQGGAISATVAVTITPANDAPIAQPIGIQQAIDGQPFNLDVGRYFSDMGSRTLNYSATDLPAGLQIDPVTGQIAGTLLNNASSEVTDGRYTVNVTARDEQGLSVSQTFVLIVTNPLPVSTSSTLTLAEDTAITGRLVGQDDDPVRFSVREEPSHGSLVLNADGSFTYTPAANYNGTDSFVYQVRDTDGAVTQATVTLVITSVNDAPTVSGRTVTIAEDTSATLNLIGTARDAEGNPLTLTTVTAQQGAVTVNPDGTVVYTPQLNFNGTDTISYTLNDGNGGITTATITIIVTPANDALTIPSGTASTSEGVSVTIPVLGSVSDADGDILTITDGSAINGSVAINPDGTLTYIPTDSFTGTDTLVYTVSDGQSSTRASLLITVSPRNMDAADIDPFVVNRSGLGRLPETASDERLEERRKAEYEPVLLDTIDGVKRLNQVAALDFDQPLAGVTHSIQPLGSNLEIEENQAPMAHAVGDLNEALRQPLQINQNAENQGDATTPSTVVADQPFTPEDAPATAQGANSQTTQDAIAQVQIPLTLEQQLQQATRQRDIQLEALSRLFIG